MTANAKEAAMNDRTPRNDESSTSLPSRGKDGNDAEWLESTLGGRQDCLNDGAGAQDDGSRDERLGIRRRPRVSDDTSSQTLYKGRLYQV